MKKKLVFTVSATIVVLAGVLGMKMSLTDIDALFVENVNALMAAEVTGKDVCYDTITVADGQMVLYCGDCKWVKGKPSTYASKKTCK